MVEWQRDEAERGRERSARQRRNLRRIANVVAAGLVVLCVIGALAYAAWRLVEVGSGIIGGANERLQAEYER
ncbi:MAG: hypothetical protein ACYTF0_08790 [Planctomycetota bacterium]